jgi:hypothetical protein
MCMLVCQHYMSRCVYACMLGFCVPVLEDSGEPREPSACRVPTQGCA